jgi:protein-L-isoaspartate(D-aspartate) O-methyltransferase
VPEKLEEQLAEGGRMIIPVGQGYSQDLILLTKKNGKLQQSNVLPVRFVPMIDEKGRKY